MGDRVNFKRSIDTTRLICYNTYIKIKQIIILKEETKLIVIGYQGIGKSTLAKRDYRYVDLESSALRHEDGTRAYNWYESYCMMAEWLSKQGYIVFVSSHEKVCDYLNKHCKEPFCAIVPSLSLKDWWLKKLHNRYNDTKDMKDALAYYRAIHWFEQDVTAIKDDIQITKEITTTDYDLARIVDSLYLKTKGERN